MGRLLSAVAATLMICLAGLLAGCSSNQAVTTTVSTGPVPSIVVLNPGPVSDLEIGQILTFTGTPQASDATAISEAVSYQSSNTAVLTISTGGVACAGTWDSLTSPLICTPGSAGVAQVTATANGVSSPATTVYVHQHIDSVAVSAAPNQTPPNASCFSAGDPMLQRQPQSFIYEAKVLSHGADITSTVGDIGWQAINTSVVTLKTATVTAPVPGLLTGQAQATASTPGTTTIFARVDGTTSTPFTFTTCPVQSISLALDQIGGTSETLPPAGSHSITATVTDTQGKTITGSFLNWCSSNPSSVLIGGSTCTTGSTANMTATAQGPGGGASIIASCTPPRCNIGLVPALPVYPPQPILLTISGTSTSTASVTALLASTGCGTLAGCISRIASVASSTGGTSSGSASLAVVNNLPSTPNSLIFAPHGNRAFLGTDRGDLGAKGVMVFDTTSGSVSQFPSAVGKVLAVSPDGTSAVVSDTVETPNQVYIFTCGTTGSSGACTGNSSVALNITGATAAAFSPDGLKAFILAGATLYIYSPISALQTISLASPATNVSFLAGGAFAYLAGGTSAISARRTCDGALADSVTAPGIPTFLDPLPDGARMLALDSPFVDIVGVSSIDTSALSGCTASVSDTFTPVNLAQGTFIPTQLIVSADGSAAYILTANQAGVLVFEILSQRTSSIPLTGNALPLRAALTPDGTKLLVGASDNMVHVLNTITAADVQQLSIPQDQTNLNSGLCVNVVFPIQTTLNITAAVQNGPNTTYTYSVASGQGPQLDAKVSIQGMANAGNDGTFTIGALGNGTFTVLNPSGTTASGQNGSGTLLFNCNPDLMAIAP